MRLAICGEFEALSLTVMAPEMLPVTVGVKPAVMVQVEPELRVLPQVLDSVKSPLGEMEIGVETAPVFFTVITLVALEEPTAVAVKLSLVGVKVIVAEPPEIPVPVRPTI